MRFVTVRDLRGRPAQVWQELSRRGELIITSNGKPIAILASTTEETLEESLRAIRAARALRALAELRHDSARRGTDRLSCKAINAEIAAVRRSRRS